MDAPLYITRTGKFLSTNEIRERTYTANCKHWLRGFCKFGSTCNFAHPGDANKERRPMKAKETGKAEAEGKEKEALPVEFTKSWRDKCEEDAFLLELGEAVYANLQACHVPRSAIPAAMKQMSSMMWRIARSPSPSSSSAAGAEREIDRLVHRVCADNTKKKCRRKRKRKGRGKRLSGEAKHLQSKARAQRLSDEAELLWSQRESCPPTHTQTRTCSEDEGSESADDVAAILSVEGPQKSQPLGQSQFFLPTDQANPLEFLLEV